MTTQITTCADVEAFARLLVSEGLCEGFHPDDSFEEYTHPDGTPLYSSNEARLRNELMEQCFEICGDDVYEIIGRITLKDTPSESIFDQNHEESYSQFNKLVSLGIRDYQPSGVSSRVVRETILSQYN